MGIFSLLLRCYVDFARTVAVCARTYKVKWNNLRCVSWLLYDFEVEKVLVIPACERLGETWRQN